VEEILFKVWKREGKEARKTGEWIEKKRGGTKGDTVNRNTKNEVRETSEKKSPGFLGKGKRKEN